MISCLKCPKYLEWYLNVYFDDIKSSKVLMLCFTLRARTFKNARSVFHVSPRCYAAAASAATAAQ